MSENPSTDRPPPHRTCEDLYAILGVAKEATSDEIRHNYKQRALETHPDKLEQGSTQEQKEEAERSFHKVREAFDVLSDTTKRRAYDRQHGIRTEAERSWSIFTDEANLRRAQERQAWADKAEARFQSRMATLRENARIKREEFLEQQRAAQEQAEMIGRMLEALCQLDSGEQKKREMQKKRDEEMKRQKEMERKRASSVGKKAKHRSRPKDDKSQLRETYTHSEPLTTDKLHRSNVEDTSPSSDKYTCSDPNPSDNEKNPYVPADFRFEEVSD